MTDNSPGSQKRRDLGYSMYKNHGTPERVGVQGERLGCRTQDSPERFTQVMDPDEPIGCIPCKGPGRQGAAKNLSRSRSLALCLPKPHEISSGESDRIHCDTRGEHGSMLQRQAREREREWGECNQHVKRNHMTDEDLLRVEMGLSEN